MIIKFLYIKGNIGDKQLYPLLFYNAYKSAQKPGEKLSFESVLMEMVKKSIELIVGPISMMSKILTAGFSKGMVEGMKKFFPVLTEDADEFDTYKEFVEKFIYFLNSERHDLGKSKFIQRYSVELFNQWNRDITS